MDAFSQEAILNSTSTSSIANEATSCFVATTVEPVQSKSIQHFIFYVHLTTSIAAIVGNVFVILVNAFGGTNDASHSLRKYLNNLAVADIMTSLLATPFTYTNIVLGHWIFPHWLCPLGQYAQLLSAFVTSTTLSIIGIERYEAWPILWTQINALTNRRG